MQLGQMASAVMGSAKSDKNRPELEQLYPKPGLTKSYQKLRRVIFAPRINPHSRFGENCFP